MVGYMMLILWASLVSSYLSFKTQHFGFAWFFLFLAFINLVATTILIFDGEPE